MMTTKRILFAVLCILLVLVIIMTGIIMHTITALFQGSQNSVRPTGGGSMFVTESTADAGGTTGSTESSSKPTETTEPPHEHAYTELVKTVSASCSTLGYTEYACSCGKVNFDDYVDPLGHSYGIGEVIAPTCTERGYTIYKCSRCGDEDIRSEAAALGHEFDEGTEIPATCTEGSHTVYKCLREGCQEVKKENVQEDIADHSFGAWSPTDFGEYQRICSVCRETELVIEPTGPIAPLKITDAQFSDVPVENTTYRLYRITVGTDDFPVIFSYLIRDYLNNGTLTYKYDAIHGMIITYMDGENPISVVLKPQQHDQCTIQATAD